MSGAKEIKKEISRRLYEIEGIKFGEFTLTSGKASPYYVDLRLVPSYPDLFESFALLSSELIGEEMDQIDRLVGVPTSGLPFAALIASKTGLPLLYTRMEKKSHGLKKAIEGVLEEGDKVCIIDDVATTGGSVKKVVEILRDQGASVENAVVMLDREEGASENLSEKSTVLKPCLKISEVVDYLEEDSTISSDQYSLVRDYLEKKGNL